jgi:hypothetical protein
MLKYCFIISYLVKTTLPDGLSFTAYTCAGELPSCAFGFNSNGVVIKAFRISVPTAGIIPAGYRFLTQAFTLDSVPPVHDEIVAGAIARNFVSLGKHAPFTLSLSLSFVSSNTPALLY